MDLTVLDIGWSPVHPPPAAPVHLWATVTNEGNTDAPDFFGVEIYIKEGENAAPPAGPWDHDQGYCLDNCNTLRPNYVHLVQNLNQGGIFTVNFAGSDLVFPERITYTVCAQIDMVFDAPGFDPWWGRYPESNETNNILCQTVVANGMWQFSLPVIYRRY